MKRNFEEIRAQLRSRVEAIARTCPYCQLRSLTWEQAEKHDGECPSHPMAKRIAELEERVRTLEAGISAAKELWEVACLRGEVHLPHPCDDPKLWTARMQTAWDELGDALAALEPKP